MSTTYHTPLAFDGTSADAADINTPLGELDSTLGTEIVTRRSADEVLSARMAVLELSSSGYVRTYADGAQSTSTTLNVDDGSQIAIGDTIVYTNAAGGYEFRIVSGVSSNALTLALAHNGVDDNTPVEVASLPALAMAGGYSSPVARLNGIDSFPFVARAAAAITAATSTAAAPRTDFDAVLVGTRWILDAFTANAEVVVLNDVDEFVRADGEDWLYSHSADAVLMFAPNDRALSVSWFGGTGNGVDDDTAAAQRTVDAGRGEAHFGLGDWQVSALEVANRRQVRLTGTAYGVWNQPGAEINDDEGRATVINHTGTGVLINVYNDGVDDGTDEEF